MNNAIVSDHTIKPVATVDTVAAVTTDDVIVLSITKENIVSGHPVNDVVAAFAMNLIGCTDIIRTR